MRHSTVPGRRHAAFVSLLLVAAAATGAPRADYVIHVSVDGLRPDAVAALGPAGAPNFFRLRNEGASTYNARTDYDYTITLPNHTCQLTGRPVLGAAGHAWIYNSDPAAGQTLHTVKGSYVAGVFDVVHDSGLRTGEHASKSKFMLYPVSWNETTGAPDVTGPDNGRNKIDVYRNLADTTVLVANLVADEAAQPFHYAFLHLADPDASGHACGWDPTPGTCYSDAVVRVDGKLGTLLAALDNDPKLRGRTALILTTDHGGTGTDHSNAALAVNYTIPFYVWGPGVAAGADLYALNPVSRLGPGTGRPPYSDPVQPIRNGDAANLALRLLGLGPVPGSSIGAAQDLAVALPLPEDLAVQAVAGNVSVSFGTAAGFRYDVQWTGDLRSGTWTNLAVDLAGTGAKLVVPDASVTGVAARFYRVRVHP